MAQRLETARRRLVAVREQRVKPARDEKVLTGRNGLMLAAFAKAARVLKRENYRRIAEQNADFLLRSLRGADGRLRRSWKNGEVRVDGFLEDYANLADGLLTLYETTSEARGFVAARELAETMMEHFIDPVGGFFDIADDHEVLVTRTKDVQDNATPSGNAMASTVLLKLAAFTGDGRYRELAEGSLRLIQPAITAAPTAFAQWLSALDFALGQPNEIAIVGTPDTACALLDIVSEKYRPNQVVAVAALEGQSPILLLNNRTQLVSKPTAYVCRAFACKLPVTEPTALAAQLSG